jgi:hypothetical protein
MGSLLDKLDKFEEKDEPEKQTKKPKKTSEDTKNLKKKSKKIKKESKKDYCDLCGKKHKITQDKKMKKKETIDWFINFMKKNGDNFTLDYLRGKKMEFEAVNEMRK